MATKGLQPVQQRVKDELGEVAEGFFLEFLQTFVLPVEPQSPQRSQVDVPETQPTQQTPIYVTQATGMVEEGEVTLFVDLDHVRLYDGTLADGIKRDFYRLEPFLRRAVRKLVEGIDESFVKTDAGTPREFFVSVFNADTVVPMRSLKADAIGKLSCFRGTVTRTSEVRPELFMGTFKCLVCQTEVPNVEQHFKLTYPCICPNPACGNRKEWQLLLDQSTFVDWQKVRVQEYNDEVPPGSLPRTLDVIVRNSSVERARAGDKCLFTGMLLAVPDVSVLTAPGERVQTLRSAGSAGIGSGEGVGGLKSLGVRELTYRLCFLASAVQPEASSLSGVAAVKGDADQDADAVRASMTPEELADVERMSRDPDVVRKLAQSLAPGVYGHLDVKKSVLLMLMGGVHKQTLEGINLRGDINVLIVGDPSCAKSQILKYVSSLVPRAVYTSGKSSSAAGLTATVVKDPDSGEFCIEAGALMLADNGVCCIDEFDKMDVKDQVAIHESMEQQSISIAKAGIQATLNARVSILAAANPVGGRYDKSKPLRSNIMLPSPIMSRFDLVHIMLDEPDDTTDFRIATHIVRMHREQENAVDVPFMKHQLLNYIRVMRTIFPVFSPEAKELLAACYVALRSEDSTVQGISTSYKITVRQLEAMIRLSEALARAYGNEVVTPGHVREARRLLKTSILHVESREVAMEEDELDGYFEGDAGGAGMVCEEAVEGQEGAEEAEDGDVLADQTNAETTSAAGKASSSSAGKGAPEEGAAGAQGQKEAPKEKEKKKKEKATRVLSSDKYRRYKQLILDRVAEHEKQQERYAEARAAQAASTGEGEGDGQPRAEDAFGDQGGLTQGELQQWFAQHLVDNGLVGSKEDLLEDLKHMRAVIRHMIDREGTLSIVHEPERAEGEDETQYRQRCLSERVLGLGLNYSFE